MQCSNQIKQHIISFHNYHDINDGLPTDGIKFSVTSGNVYNIGYLPRIFPFMELESVYNAMDINIQPSLDRTTKNKRIAKDFKPSGSLCPSSNGVYVTNISVSTFTEPPYFTMHYYGIAGAVGAIPGTSPPIEYPLLSNPTLGKIAKNGTINWGEALPLAAITDGTSNTFGLGEISWDGCKNYSQWHRGAVVTNLGTDLYYITSSKSAATDNPINTKNPHRFTSSDPLSNLGAFGSDHPTGTQFSLMDGSIRFIAQTVNTDIIKELVTIDGGEIVKLP
jgi:hypothetical protein